MSASRKTHGPGARSVIASFLALVALLAVLFASPGVRAAPPTLTILSPEDGAVIGNGTPVVLSFLVSDFDLVQPGRVGEVSTPTEGHVAVTVDGVATALAYRIAPLVLSLASGPHVIALQLRQSNGTPLAPDVSASVTVTLTQGPAAGPPTLAVIAPEPDLATGHDVNVAVQVGNFTLVDPRGQPNVPGEGHLLIRVEGAYYSELSSYAPAFLVDLADGWNTITVHLTNNDGTMLDPDVSATTRVYIKPATAVYVLEAVNVGIIAVLSVVLALEIRRSRATSKGP